MDAVRGQGDDEIDRAALAALATGAQPGTPAAPAEPTPSGSPPPSDGWMPDWSGTQPGAVTAESTPVGGVPIVAGPARPHRLRRIVVRGALVAVLLGVVYYGVNLFLVWQVGRSDQATSVDAIVVMGAAQYDGRPSPELQARLDQVVILWQRGLAPLVVVTGGKLPGDRFTEAEASAEYLVAHGVPRGVILRENAAHTSYDSLVGVRDLLTARGLHRVLLVSDPFHSLRIRLTAQELGLVAYVSPTRTSPVQGANEFWREVKEAAGISLGRIIGFRRLLSLTG